MELSNIPSSLAGITTDLWPIVVSADRMTQQEL